MIINTVLTTDTTPTTHASTHATGGTDPITPSSIGAAASSDLDEKVDKVSGKGLSTNDYTTEEKNKLAGIATGAEVNVQSDWNAESGDALILNKPTSMTPTAHASTHATGGSDEIAPADIGAEAAFDKNTAFNKNFETTATNIKMNGTQSAGSLSTVARADHIHPTDTSRASATDLANHLSASNPHSITKSTIGLSNVVDGAQVNVIETVKRNGTALTITDKAVNVTVPTKTSELTNDSGFLTSAPVTSVNTKTGAVTLDAEDVGALPDSTVIPSTLAELTADATHRLVTDTEKSTWNGKQNALTFDDAPTASSSNPVKSGGVYAALAGKVDTVSGKGLSTNDYTTAEKTKLSGIATGAEVNVLTAVKDSSGTALTITSKAVQLSKAAVGLGNVDNTADASKTFAASQITTGQFAIARLPVGTTSSTVCAGNDSRLSDARTPTSHNHAGSEITSGTVAYARLPVGSSASTVCAGDDSRLSDARTPKTHASTHNIGGTDAIATASASSNGLLSSTDWSTFNGKQDLQTDYFLSTIPPNATLTKSNMDANGVYLTYTWTIAKITGANQKAGKWVSTLSADYSRRTLTVYDIDQTNVVFSCVFNRTLDSYGNLVSEVEAS